MAEKILHLKLKYKNKYLDIAKFKRDFKDKFLIGSNKHIFWQILDPKFPNKHTLITRKKDDFYMNILSNMDVHVNKKDSTLTKQEMEKKKIIKNNQFKLDKNTSGEITFSKDWGIEYAFVKPYHVARTKEDIENFRKYHRKPKLTGEQKFTRAFLIIAWLFTIVGIVIFEKNYEPPQRVDFQDRLRSIEQQATLIQADFAEDVQVKPDEPDQADLPPDNYNKAANEGEAAEQAAAAEAEVMAEIENIFGGLDGVEGMEGDAGENVLIEVSEAGIAAVESDNSSGGLSADVWSDIGVSNAGEAGADAILQGAGELGDIGAVDLGGLAIGKNTGNFENVNAADLGGDLGNYKIVSVRGQQEFESVRRSFGGIPLLQEGNVNIAETQQAKTELASIEQQVNTLTPRLSQLYTTESLKYNMYGTLHFEIIINESGKVVAVQVSYAKGSYFTNEFLDKAKAVVKGWNIEVKKPTRYKFRRTFIRSN